MAGRFLRSFGIALSALAAFSPGLAFAAAGHPTSGEIGFQESVTIDIPQCTIPGNPPIVIPEDSSTNLISTPPVAGNSQLMVTSAFTGTNLSMPAGQAPDGCVLAPIAGTDIGASNPLITLTTSVTCQINGADINATVTAKLVGAW